MNRYTMATLAFMGCATPATADDCLASKQVQMQLVDTAFLIYKEDHQTAVDLLATAFSSYGLKNFSTSTKQLMQAYSFTQDANIGGIAIASAVDEIKAVECPASRRVLVPGQSN